MLSALFLTFLFPTGLLLGYPPQLSYLVKPVMPLAWYGSIQIPAVQLVKVPNAQTFYPTFKPTPRPSPATALKPTPTPLPAVFPTPMSQPATTPVIPILTTPAPTEQPAPLPTKTPAPVNYDSQTNYFINQINNYRHSQGLSPVQPDPYACNFAKIRASEISNAFNHDGFTNRINNKSLPYPSYSLVTENIAMNSNYQDVVNQWINSPGHAANMRANTPYVCVEATGNYYAYEGWKP